MTERPLTARIRPDGPPSLAEVRQAGGYDALARALARMSPEDVTAEVLASGLRGRGGAGFPTGRKWSFVPPDDGSGPRYVVANADEMEPGTFKDRCLLEGDPHALIEGMLLTGWAIGASVGYVFVRWAYRRGREALRAAIDEARAAGLLGRRVLGHNFDFDIHVHVSAGRYICGEETALLEALEGRRPIPRTKPPYPQVSGLWGRPTLVQNVETLCCVPHIIGRGSSWFRGLGRGAACGTKLYGVSGRVRRPGLWELPMGTTLRELLQRAGGMVDGRRFRGCLPGGGSTAFLTEDRLDTALDFDSVEAAGSRLGTGTAIVLDDRTCPVGMVANLERFYARESCGWCTPCREGLPWVARLLDALEAGSAGPDALAALDRLSRSLGPGRTACALAPGAAAPLTSALQHFRSDFEAHVGGGCTYGGGL